jgi:hypothetical protein
MYTGDTYSTCLSGKENSTNNTKSFLCSETINSSMICYCSNPTAPIEYAGSGDCTIKQLPESDGINTYGLFIPTQTSNLQISGFPPNTFTGNWTIEFFVYVPPNTSPDGVVWNTSNSSELAIWDYKYMPGKKLFDNINYFLGSQIYINNGTSISADVFTRQSSNKSISNKSSRADDKVYSTISSGWVSIILQYDSSNTTYNYSLLITQRQGQTSNNMLPNNSQTNFGTQDALKTLIFGIPKYISYTIGIKDVYITNLRISNIARYSNTASPNIIWPENPLYKSDSNTVYFNSFNIPSTITTNGYLLSQIVQ